MEQVLPELTELQFRIFDGMADDYEDVEQLYLYANRDFAAEREKGVSFPRAVLEIRFPLREVMDEIASMLRHGYVEAKYSNDEHAAPLEPLDFTQLQHYWFGPMKKGQSACAAARNWKLAT